MRRRSAPSKQRRTGYPPKAVTVVLSEDTLVVTLHEALSPAEKALARTPEGAAQVQEFHRQLFKDSADLLRQEIKRITGIAVGEAAAEIETTTGAVVHAFTTGTMVQVFQLAGRISAETWNGSGPRRSITKNGGFAMLVLSRKNQESVVIGGTDGVHRLLKVTVLGIQGTHVKLGFEVDADVPVHRSEVWERIKAEAAPTTSALLCRVHATDANSARDRQLLAPWTLHRRIEDDALGHFLRRRTENAWYYFDRDLGSDASGGGGHAAHLASQQKLGLWPERRAGIDCGNPARPAAHGTPLIITCRESEGKDNMRTLFGLFVLLLVGIAALGFYRGWFHFSTNSTDQKLQRHDYRGPRTNSTRMRARPGMRWRGSDKRPRKRPAVPADKVEQHAGQP